MNLHFKEALEKGFVEPVLLSDGTQFELDGKKYYQPTESGAKMAIARFHQALDIIRMHEELKMSYKDLKSSWIQVKELAMTIISSRDGSEIQNAALDLLTLQQRVETRIDFGKDIEQIYQITAIYFLIETEDPGALNNEIIDSKIKSFKSKPELYAFFLRLPLSHYLGSSLALDSATLNYLAELKKLELLDLKAYLIKLQMSGRESDTTSYILSQMETLSESAGLIASLSRLTSTQSAE